MTHTLADTEDIKDNISSWIRILDEATPAPRKPYTAPMVTRVPLVPEELLVASCAKTPSICHLHGTIQQTKS